MYKILTTAKAANKNDRILNFDLTSIQGKYILTYGESITFPRIYSK